MEDLTEIYLQDPEQLKISLDKEDEDLSLIFHSLNLIPNLSDLQYIYSVVGDGLTEKITQTLKSGKEECKAEILILLVRLYSLLGEKVQNVIRSYCLQTVFALNKQEIRLKIISCKLLAQIIIYHKDDEQVNALLRQYQQFIQQNLSNSNVNLGVLCALINVIPLMLDFFMDELIQFLVRLSEQHVPELQGFRKQSIRKTIKNVICALLKSHSELSQQLSFGLMDCLVNQIKISKADTNQFYQILQTRGYDYSKLKGGVDLFKLTPEQISQAVVAALQHYANTNRQSVPQFNLPSGELSIHVVSEMIIQSLLAFNPQQQADNGLLHWQQIISSIQHYCQQALQIQIQSLSQVTSVMETTTKSNKFITTTQPFELKSINIDDVGGILEFVLSGLLESFAKLEPPSQLLENDGSQVILASRKRKSPDEMVDDVLGVEFKGSRAHWTMIIARTFAQLESKRKMFIEFLLQDFPQRFDLCVRWLWEFHYLDHLKSSDTYGQVFRALIDDMFQEQSSKFVPWMKNQVQIFKIFISAVPKIPHDFLKEFAQKFLLIEFNLPQPTPIQELQYTFIVDLLLDLCIHKSVYRKSFFPLLINQCFDSVKQELTLGVLKQLWMADGGFFYPLYNVFQDAIIDKFINDSDNTNVYMRIFIEIIPQKPELLKILLDQIDLKLDLKPLLIEYLCNQGMPKDETELSYKLLIQIDKGDFFQQLIERLTNYPSEYLQECPKVFTRLVLEKDKNLLVTICNGDGLTRDEIMEAINQLTQTQPEFYTNYIDQLLQPPSLLSPIELLLFINNCCPINQIAINPKRSADAISLLVNKSQQLSQKSITAAINLMMSQYSSGSQYPLLFMKTVLSYLIKYGQDARGFILSQVLAPLCNLRLLWMASKDRLQKPEEIRVGKVLWHSFVLCLRESSPNSFVLLVQLQKDRLKMILDKLGPEFMEEFLKWCRAEVEGPRGKKVKEVLEFF